MKVALLVCALAGTAFADSGTEYLDRYNADPTAANADELVYNAGVAFEQEHSVAAAIQAFALLEKSFPNSKLTARAIARAGVLYANIAMYDRAAEKLELYAHRYAGEKDARDAMSDAVYYRKAIDDRAKAIEDTKYLVRTFGVKAPDLAADATWSLSAFYDDDPDAAITQMRDYLKQFGAKAGPAHVVMANAKIGQLLLTKSCHGKTFDGLCVTSSEPTRSCGKGTTHALTPVKRDDKTRKEAVASLTTAIAEFEKQHPDDPAARYYYGQAKLALADLDLETYLGLAFPKGLDFDPTNKKARQTSQMKFAQWLTDKQKLGVKANSEYQAVLSIKDAASTLTAAERMGTIALAFSSTLVTAEIPRNIRSNADAADAYCDAMRDAADPLEARAVEGFAVCLEKSTELGWFGDSSQVCERELLRLKPVDFPALNEHHREPLATAPIVAGEPAPRD
jgi:outer membrane protein assembly factor BamD (BamD/ComL family)